ncbi:thiamine phosphate synthase [Pedobacter panaciterrae]|uniref:Thiamine phosphate synthase n=1 Tax=Pedobacter panaciterrae TaxID=363849 RepID=A0ABU8NTC6_9SPHI
MNVIVIANPCMVDNESNIINQLFESGLDIFHLRKDSYTRAHYNQLISEIDEAYHSRIALHDYHELAGDFGINRLHYKEAHRKQLQEAKTMLNFNDTVLSTSIHQLEDINNLQEFDYAFFGPVFNSISKPGYAGVLNRDFILPQRLNNTKLIALGGIDDKNAEALSLMGFDGVAVLGFIWNDPSKAISNFKRIQER